MGNKIIRFKEEDLTKILSKIIKEQSSLNQRSRNNKEFILKVNNTMQSLYEILEEVPKENPDNKETRQSIMRCVHYLWMLVN